MNTLVNRKLSLWPFWSKNRKPT